MKFVPRSERIFLTDPRIKRKCLGPFIKLVMAIDSITSLWIPLELMHINITAQRLLLAKPPLVRRRNCPGSKNIQPNAGERWADEKTISREISHLLSLGRTLQSSACNTMVNGSAHASPAANHPEPSCANSSFSKDTPHKQQPYMVFPKNYHRVLFI